MSAVALAKPESDTVPKNTYAQILKSSALVGGSQVLNIAIGMVRTKAMALLLGPSGFGLFGLYGSISDLTQSVAGMGVNSSGVRQIAEAGASGDEERIGQTATALRRTSLVLGLLGAAFLVFFCRPVSGLTFGDERHAKAVALLSIAVFLRLVSAGQGALIQGTRRMADLAKMSVLGAVYGAVIAIPLVYFFRQSGIVPSLIGVAGMMLITSWWFSRMIKIAVPRMNGARVLREVVPLVRVGIAFMGANLMTMGSSYVIRIVVLRRLGIEATGLYQSAWTLGGLYVSFILQAMGADFYPRLTANVNDHKTCNRLVNEQARVGLLMAGPGAIATLTFAPLVLSLFYSPRFAAAVGILRWTCLGTTLQVITWPMGFVSLAKGRSSVFFWSDFIWTVFYLGLAWACVRLFGLTGTGVSFFGANIFHALMTYPIARWLTGFRWSRENTRTGLLMFSLIATVFCGLSILPLPLATCVGSIAAIIAAGYSIRTLAVLLSCDQVAPSSSLRVFARLRIFAGNGGGRPS